MSINIRIESTEILLLMLELVIVHPVVVNARVFYNTAILQSA